MSRRLPRDGVQQGGKRVTYLDNHLHAVSREQSERLNHISVRHRPESSLRTYAVVSEFADLFGRKLEWV